jgi:hypothetical protein
MLFKIALGLLSLWLVGVAGAYSIGDLVHVVLLVGLMLLMLAALRARDAAAGHASRKTNDRSGGAARADRP